MRLAKQSERVMTAQPLLNDKLLARSKSGHPHFLDENIFAPSVGELGLLEDPDRLLEFLDLVQYVTTVLELFSRLNQVIADLSDEDILPLVQRNGGGGGSFIYDTFKYAEMLSDDITLPSTSVCVEKFFRACAEERVTDALALRWSEELKENAYEDLRGKHFQYLPGHLVAQYYWATLDKKIVERFPRASEEIYEARKCLVCGRNTACVFHLMRAVEHLLRAFAIAVGVKQSSDIPIEHKQWANLIEEAESKINKWLKTRKKSRPEISAAANILRASLADFYSFKDSVRNDVMHTRSGLMDEASAVGVMNRVIGCFERLAPCLDENQDWSILDESFWS